MTPSTSTAAQKPAALSTPNLDLTDNITKTYRATRKGLGLIGLAFPVLLYLGGVVRARLHLQESMSAYYHASALSQAYEILHPGTYVHPSEGVMRDWFVGLLFVIGIIFFLYKGFTPMEDWALNAAGIMALGVALFPMAWGTEFKGDEIEISGIQFSVHGFCAVALFLCIAYVCIFRAPDTLSLVQPDQLRARYRLTYKCLGAAMIVFPLAAFVLSSVLHLRNSSTFFVEMAGVWVFATYWLVKSHEILHTEADRKAAQGLLKVEPHTVKTHFWHELKITE
jgi:hypothetical protein